LHQVVSGVTGIVYKEKNLCIREKMGEQNIVKEIKQYQKHWLQHIQRTDRQNTETSTAIQTERKKEHRATEKETEGPTSSGGLTLCGT
jgi:hypothetical protein